MASKLANKQNTLNNNSKINTNSKSTQSSAPPAKKDIPQSSKQPIKNNKALVKDTKVEEEEKKVLQEEKIVKSSVDDVKTIQPRKIKLIQYMNVSQQCRDQNITPIFIDPDGQAFIFCQYKSTLIDISQFQLQELMGSTDKEKFIQSSRQKFVGNLKSGGQVSLFMDQMIYNLNSIFGGQKFWEPQKLFNHQEVMKQSFHQSKILKPEEDYDFEGNRGLFIAQKDFHTIILLNIDYQQSKDIQEQIGVQNGPFQVIHILKN